MLIFIDTVSKHINKPKIINHIGILCCNGHLSIVMEPIYYKNST